MKELLRAHELTEMIRQAINEAVKPITKKHGASINIKACFDYLSDSSDEMVPRIEVSIQIYTD